MIIVCDKISHFGQCVIPIIKGIHVVLCVCAGCNPQSLRYVPDIIFQFSFYPEHKITVCALLTKLRRSHFSCLRIITVYPSPIELVVFLILHRQIAANIKKVSVYKRGNSIAIVSPDHVRGKNSLEAAAIITEFFVVLVLICNFWRHGIPK